MGERIKRVPRKVAGLIEADGQAHIVPVNFGIDPKKGWPTKLNWMEKSFELIGNSKQEGRAVYREVVEEPVQLLSPEEEIESLEATCEMFHKQNFDLRKRNEDQSGTIKKLLHRLKNLECELIELRSMLKSNNETPTKEV